jgi:hypothetical protein
MSSRRQDQAMHKKDGKEFKLRGGPAQTTSWVQLLGDGSLKVGFYDFSDQTESMTGGESEYFAIVPPRGVEVVAAKLDVADVDTESGGEALTAKLQEDFESYDDLTDWLGDHGVAFHVERNPWPGS